MGPAFTHPTDGCATLSPDGKKVAVGTSEGRVMHIDLKSGEECELPGRHREGVGSVMFSPTGENLVSRAGPELKLWDLANIQLMANFEVYHAAAFSPDGTTLAVSCEETPGEVYALKLYDLTRKKLATLDLHNSSIDAVAFSPDGAMLASGVWYGIRILNVRTRTQLPFKIEGHTDPVSSLAFSPSGARLASISRHAAVKLWDVKTGDQTITLKVHRSRFPSVAFSPHGETLAATDGDDSVKLWRAATKDEARNAGS